MTVRYHNRGGRQIPDYMCQKEGIEHGEPFCQQIRGEQIDKTISELLVQTMTPMALDVALSVQQEIQSRMEEVDRLRRKQVERARYESDLAQRRYMNVDPANRLVAGSLEAEWNNKLRALGQAQEEYEHVRQTDRAAVDEAQRARIATLASDFPRLWQDPKTPDRERKRMVRLILEDVTLIRGNEIAMHVRFKGGATRSFTLPRPLAAPELRKTDAEVIHEIDRLLDEHTEREIALILNQKGLRSGTGKPFTRNMIVHLKYAYHLTDRYTRLRACGKLSAEEVAEHLGLAVTSVKDWQHRGLLRAHRCNDRGVCLFEPPAPDLPRKFAHKQSYLQQKQTISACDQRGAV
ncbi:MAG: hypothetical protein WB919_17420 [Candidatus Sulfotelmatobacter sp.]